MKKSVILFMVILSSAFAFSQNQKYSKVKIEIPGNGMRELGKLGIATDEGIILKNGFYITDLSDAELEKLSNNGFNYEILIRDVNKFYKERNTPDKSGQEIIPKNISELQSACSGTSNFQVPQNFDYGSMGGYFTLNEMLDILDTMKAKYPNLISTKHTIGTQTTIEGRNLYWVRISDNPDTDENEPEALYTAATHAREVEGVSQLIFFMYYLLENYTTNAEIKYIVDNTELYFVPCLNPDGYVYNETTDPQGGGMWRKNRRNNGGGSYGVDLNRNFGYMWGYDDIGSSPDPNDETYRGIAGFSETETQIIKYFCEQHNFKIALNYHTYSNDLICPWGYNSQQTPDSVIFNAIGTLLTEFNGYTFALNSATVGYTTNGTQDDWMYGEQTTKEKIFSMTPEVGSVWDGFWPAFERIIPLAQENMPANIYLALLTQKYAIAKDISSNYITQQQGYFKFNIQRLGLDTGNCTFTVSIQPVSNNISGTGTPKTFSSLQFLMSADDSISYTLSLGINTGDRIKYLLTVDNGACSFSDTITKVYGNAQIVFSDDCSNTNKWVTDTWSTTTEAYHSAPECITDSPYSDYQPGISESITVLNNIDLHTALYAELTFWAKWDIQKYTDYVQLKISTDNGATWQPLCGKYSSAGNYMINEPIFSDIKNSWRHEIINLNDYIGHNIKLQFTITSDSQYWQTDGFYFDDVFVYAVFSSGLEIMPHHSVPGGLYLGRFVPNPATDLITFNYNVPAGNKNSIFYIYNSIGDIVISKGIDPGKNASSVSLKELPAGIYFCCIRWNGQKSDIQKIVKY
ncbi:MAG: immune inhibitor A [Bacteroidia bacterium]|nr:immune inhibitor A [Bacteroidia bacterium]